MTSQANGSYGLAELNQETKFGGIGGLKHRDVPRIDMSNFEARKAEIADQLWDASTAIGFFQLVNHGIAQEQIDEAFDMTARFFDLAQDAKAKMPLGKGTNAAGNTRARCGPRPAPPTIRSLTRSRCRGWQICGPTAASCPASSAPCWPSSVPTGRSA